VSTPQVSCVICTVDRSESIAAAVASVLRGDLRDIELVVIDQSADDRTRDACAPFAADPRFRYVHNLRRGLSRAYNRGIAETRAPILAFTDDDCVAPTDWAASILAVFEREPDIDMVYGQVIAPQAWPAGTHIPTLLYDRPERISRGTGVRIIGMGANFAARRALFERVGLFDEALGGGGPLRSSQDFDFQYRVFRAGGVIRLSPEVNVEHHGARTIGEQWSRTLQAYGIGDGAFYWKHVRCGDLTALRLTLGRLLKLSVREALNPIRRRSSHATYLRYFLAGIRESMRFPVDRERRLYVVGEQ